MKRKILVIDDELVIRKAFQLTFENTPYELVTVDSGMKGIEKIRSDEFELVFLDLKMPGMDGIETLRKIREFNNDILIYIFTAFHNDYMQSLDEAADQGLDFEIFHKPLDGKSLISLVEGVFK